MTNHGGERRSVWKDEDEAKKFVHPRLLRAMDNSPLSYSTEQVLELQQERGVMAVLELIAQRNSRATKEIYGEDYPLIKGVHYDL